MSTETSTIDQALSQTTESTTESTPSTETTQSNDYDPKVAAERFARLAAEEKRKVQERQSWIKEKQSFDQEKSELLKYKEMIEKIKNNDVSVLDQINPNYYEQATSFKLNNSEPTIDYRFQEFESKIAKLLDEKLQSKVQEYETKEQENRKNQMQILRQGWIKDLNEHFSKDTVKSNYPLLTDQKDYSELILEAIETARDKQNKSITPEQAAEILEASLKNEYKTQALKYKDFYLNTILDDLGISKEQFDKLSPKMKNEIKDAANMEARSSNITLSNTPNSQNAAIERPKPKSKLESIEELAKLIKIKKD